MSAGRRISDSDPILDIDGLFEPRVTQRILAAIDRDEDPHLAIDVCRRAIFQQANAIKKLRQDLIVLQEQLRESREWTESGIWVVVKERLQEGAIDWVKWGIRAVIGLVGTALLTAFGLILKFAIKGLTT